MQTNYTHDELTASIDRVLMAIIKDAIENLIPEGDLGLPYYKIKLLKDSLDKKVYVTVRRINRPPTSGTKEKPDIEIFGGHIIVEIKTKESDLESGKKQLERYLRKYYKDVAKAGIVTTGLHWVIYRYTKDKLVEIGRYKGNEKEYRSGSIERTIILEKDLCEALSNLVRNVLIQSNAYRYPPTPDNIFKVFYTVIADVSDILRIMDEYNIRNKAIYLSYKEILLRIYSELSDNELDILFATHTILQMIVNMAFAGAMGSLEKMTPLRICAGEGFKYDITVPHLLWWKEIIRSDSKAKDVISEICDDIYSKALLFDWTLPIVEDVFSHLYEDFIDRVLRYKIGEYYTPWWLIEFIIMTMKKHFKLNFNGKIVFDPACGSGRFLVRAFHEKIDSGEDPRKAYYEIIGLDINPLATAIARAEVMIAFSRIADKQEIPGSPLIFWGDFLSSEIGLHAELVDQLKVMLNKLSYLIFHDKKIMMYLSNLEQNKLLVFLSRLEERLAQIFRKLGRGEHFNDVLLHIKKLQVYNLMDNTIKYLILNILEDSGFIGNIIKLIEEYGDEIWAIPISSHIFMTFISKVRPNIVLTNPPWLKLSELPKSKWGDKVKAYIKDKIVNKYRLNIPGLSKVSMAGDISTLFLFVIMNILNKEEGYVGIVMPAEQSYSPRSPHGVGKIFTYTVLLENNAEGAAIYVGDAFKHGRNATVLVVRRRKGIDSKN